MIASTRLLCAALLVAAAFSTGVSAIGSCNIDMCTSCLLGNCVYCADGYYATNGTCKSCETENCRSCGLAGRCTSCNDGYELTYKMTDDDSTRYPKYGYCEVKKAPATCNDTQCTSCLGGRCLACKAGYYAKEGVCASCEAAHCRHCLGNGQCIFCEGNYSLIYVNFTSDGVDTYGYGKCVNAASLTGVSVAFMAAGLALLAAFVV